MVYSYIMYNNLFKVQNLLYSEINNPFVRFEHKEVEIDFMGA